MLNSILVVDDNPVDLEIISLACKNLDCLVEPVLCPREALEKYKAEKYALVLTDYWMESISGIDLVTKIKEYDPDAKCLLMTGRPDAKINNFICEMDLTPPIKKPIRPIHLIEQIRVALNTHRGATQTLSRVAITNRMDQCVALLGQSPAICQARRKIVELATVHKPIFLEGPFGVGKPDVVNFIHRNGGHADSRIVTCNCREMTAEEMREQIISEDGRLGTCLEEAANATLVFNNIDFIPMELQQHLAPVIRELSKQTQIIAWANASLDELLEAGAIDDELYFEMSLHTIHLPALSERPTDIEEIARFVAGSPEAFDLTRQMDATEIDLLVATLRKSELKGNLRELIQRVRLTALSIDTAEESGKSDKLKCTA